MLPLVNSDTDSPLIGRLNGKIQDYNKAYQEVDKGGDNHLCLHLLQEISTIVESQKMYLTSQFHINPYEIELVANYGGLANELNKLVTDLPSCNDSQIPHVLPTLLKSKSEIPTAQQWTRTIRLNSSKRWKELLGSTPQNELTSQLENLNRMKDVLHGNSSPEEYERYYYELQKFRKDITNKLVYELDDERECNNFRSLLSSVNSEIEASRVHIPKLREREESMQRFLSSPLSEEMSKLSQEELARLADLFKKDNAFNLNLPMGSEISAAIDGLADYDLNEDELEKLKEYFKKMNGPSPPDLSIEEIARVVPGLADRSLTETELKSLKEFFTEPSEEIYKILPILRDYDISYLGGGNNKNWQLIDHERGEQYVIQSKFMTNTNQALLNEQTTSTLSHGIGQEYFPERALLDHGSSFTIVDVAPKGNLLHEAHENKKKNNEEKFMASSMRRVHELLSISETMLEQGIIHPDIKLTNFLIDKSNNITIIDTKTLASIPEGGFVKRGSFETSARYMTPEHKRGEPIINAEKHMTYQLGLAIYEELVQPTHETDQHGVSWQEKLNFEDQVFSGEVGQELANLIQEMTNEDPLKRPTLAEAQQRSELLLSKYEKFSKLSEQRQLIDAMAEEDLAKESIALARTMVSIANQIDENDKFIQANPADESLKEIRRTLEEKLERYDTRKEMVDKAYHSKATQQDSSGKEHALDTSEKFLQRKQLHQQALQQASEKTVQAEEKVAEHKRTDISLHK